MMKKSLCEDCTRFFLVTFLKVVLYYVNLLSLAVRYTCSDSIRLATVQKHWLENKKDIRGI